MAEEFHVRFENEQDATEVLLEIPKADFMKETALVEAGWALPTTNN